MVFLLIALALTLVLYGREMNHGWSMQ